MSSDLRERLLHWLDASPSELAGLGVLLTGSVLALLLLTRAAAPTGTPSADLVDEAPTGGPVATAVTVHVVGEVVAPGVVALGLGARVRDAIAAAGGPTSAARLDAVNLARPVHDGEQLVVPGPDAVVGTSAEGGAADGAIDADGRVDLNRATAADLETLPGIGPVLARRIVDHREANGPFTSPGDLRQVSGIGERTFQSLAELVVVR